VNSYINHFILSGIYCQPAQNSGWLPNQLSIEARVVSWTRSLLDANII